MEQFHGLAGITGIPEVTLLVRISLVGAGWYRMALCVPFLADWSMRGSDDLSQLHVISRPLVGQHRFLLILVSKFQNARKREGKP